MKHRKSKLSSAGRKMLSGDFSGGKRPKKKKVKKKRLKTFRERRMDRIIENKP